MNRYWRALMVLGTAVIVVSAFLEVAPQLRRRLGRNCILYSVGLVYSINFWWAVGRPRL